MKNDRASETSKLHIVTWMWVPLYVIENECSLGQKVCSAVMLAVDGATVVPFLFGAIPQFTPASRCWSWALPLSVQEFEDCITSVILPAARKQPSPECGHCFFFTTFCGELKGFVFFFLRNSELGVLSVLGERLGGMKFGSGASQLSCFSMKRL